MTIRYFPRKSWVILQSDSILTFSNSFQLSIKFQLLKNENAGK